MLFRGCLPSAKIPGPSADPRPRFWVSSIHRVALPFAASPSSSSADLGAPIEQVDPDRLEPSGSHSARIWTNRLLPRLRRRHPAHHRPRHRSAAGSHRRSRLEQGKISIKFQLNFDGNSINFWNILEQPHRISVRSVTPRRRASLDAACTMVIGKEVPSAPTCVRVSHVTATSALISWLPANSNYQHAVCVNHVEVRTVKPGIFRHTISGNCPA